MKERHVLGLSGGKDSAALAVHMSEKYPSIPIEYYFTDTGYELKETYKFLDKLKTRLSRPIKYIQPKNTFDYYMKKYNNFLPSATARWCTIEMKLKPFEKWLAPSLKEGTKIYIAIAGLAAHLAGAIAAKTTKPVIGVPADNGPLKGIDALLSTVQMPKGIPVSTVAIGSTGATNAGYHAAQILSLGSEEIAKKKKN